jgi:hypothetical protein
LGELVLLYEVLHERDVGVVWDQVEDALRHLIKVSVELLLLEFLLVEVVWILVDSYSQQKILRGARPEHIVLHFARLPLQGQLLHRPQPFAHKRRCCLLLILLDYLSH